MFHLDQLRPLIDEFIKAGREFGFLCFAAATAHHPRDSGWPTVVTVDGSSSHGIPEYMWKDMLYSNRRALLPIEDGIWIEVDGQLWEGIFFHQAADWNEEDANEATRSEIDEPSFDRALKRFRELGRQAAAFFPRPIPTMYPAEYDVRCCRDEYARWLETICESPSIEVDLQHPAVLKRVPGNIFAASARAIEELDRRQGGSFANVNSPDASIATLGPQVDHLSTAPPTSDFKFHGVKETIPVKTLREQEQAFLNCQGPILPKRCVASHHKLMKMIHERAERFTHFDPSVPERWSRAQAEAQTSLVREASVKLGVETGEILDADIARGTEMMLYALLSHSDSPEQPQSAGVQPLFDHKAIAAAVRELTRLIRKFCPLKGGTLVETGTPAVFDRDTSAHNAIAVEWVRLQRLLNPDGKPRHFSALENSHLIQSARSPEEHADVATIWKILCKSDFDFSSARIDVKNRRWSPGRLPTLDPADLSALDAAAEGIANARQDDHELSGKPPTSDSQYDEAESGGGTPNDSWEELRAWVPNNLKGKQRSVVEILIENDGACPVADLAAHARIEWEVPFTNAFNSIRQALNAKLDKAGWRISRHDATARLSKIGQK